MASSRFNAVLEDPDHWISPQQTRWLRPRGTFRNVIYLLLYIFNWFSVRCLFRLQVDGLEDLPSRGPYIVAPNHASAFDPPILAASLPLKVLQQTFWASKQSTVLQTRMRRLMSWLTRVIPIDSDASALAVGVTILRRQNNLVWFPEGRRSLDGTLKKFKPGIGVLLSGCDVPVVPVSINGAYHAFAPGSRIPRFRTSIVVRIGKPARKQQLLTDSPAANAEDTDILIEAIRSRILELQKPDQNAK